MCDYQANMLECHVKTLFEKLNADIVERFEIGLEHPWMSEFLSPETPWGKAFHNFVEEHQPVRYETDKEVDEIRVVEKVKIGVVGSNGSKFIFVFKKNESLKYQYATVFWHS